MSTKQQTRQLIELIQVVIDTPMEEMMTPELQQFLKQLRELGNQFFSKPKEPLAWEWLKKNANPQMAKPQQLRNRLAQEQRDHLQKQGQRDHEMIMKKLKKLKKLEVMPVKITPLSETKAAVEFLTEDQVPVPTKLLRRLMNARPRELSEVVKQLTRYAGSVDEPSET